MMNNSIIEDISVQFLISRSNPPKMLASAKKPFNKRSLFVQMFVVLSLPHTDVVPACALAEKLRLAIKDIAIPIVGHKTCSFGVTSFCNSDSADSLLVRADNALYQAKKWLYVE